MTNGKFRILLQFQTDFEYSFYISFRLTQSICLTDLFSFQGTSRLPERTEGGEKEFLFSRLYRVRSLHFEPDYFLKSGNFLNFRMIASLRVLIVFCGRPVTLAYSRSVSPS